MGFCWGEGVVGVCWEEEKGQRSQEDQEEGVDVDVGGGCCCGEGFGIESEADWAAAARCCRACSSQSSLVLWSTGHFCSPSGEASGLRSDMVVLRLVG